MNVVNETPFSFAIFPGRLSFPGHSATFIVKATFNLKNMAALDVADEQAFATGDEYYPDDDEQQGGFRYASDFSCFKPRADTFVVGHCYAPQETRITSCVAKFAIDGQSRDIHVFGNRFWESKAGVLSVNGPEPFEKIELRYENSFGGEGFKQNPAGKGAGKVSLENGGVLWPLPNLEDPQQRIGSPENRPDPAGFGPLHSSWQYRNDKLGAYDEKWLEKKWPWFPDDFDPTYFNASPPAQQLSSYLVGDEMLQFINMHPDIQDYRTRMPGLTVRCFTRTHSREPSIGKAFQEIGMNLDTLWVDMDAEQAVLVWRGWSRVDSEEMDDIKDILVIAEALDVQPAEAEDAYGLLKKRMAELDQDLEEEKPEAIAMAEEAIEEAPVDADAILAREEANSRRILIEAGMDPDNLPEPTEKEKKQEAELLAGLGLEAREENTMTREQVEARVLNRESFFQEDLTGLDLGGIDFSGIDLRETNLSELDLRGGKFSSADLSGAILSGANLTRSDLRCTCLRGADLTGAVLNESELEGANLENAVFESCTSESVNFEKVQAAGADFSAARLRGSRFTNAVLIGASFEEADLNHTMMMESQLQNVKFDQVTAIYANFTDADMTGIRASDNCDFSGAVFNGCQLEGANFEGACCIQADFSYSDMHDGNLIAANLKDANLTCTDLRQAKLARANLENASLVQTNLYEASLEKTILKNADFRGANLYGAELLDAEILHSNFEQANLGMTKLEKTR